MSHAPMTFLTFLTLSMLGAGFGAFPTDTLLTLWTFSGWPGRSKCVNRVNKVSRQTSAKPCESSEVSKGQKCHTIKARNDARG